VTGKCWNSGIRDVSQKDVDLRVHSRYAAVPAISRSRATRCWPASMSSAKRALCSSRKRCMSSGAWRTSAQAGVAGRPAAPLQQVLSDRAPDDRQGDSGKGDQRTGPVAPEHVQPAIPGIGRCPPGSPTDFTTGASTASSRAALTAELGSHQIDVADWMFGATRSSWSAWAGSIYVHDGRDIYDKQSS